MISTLCRRATAASARRRSSLKVIVVGLCRLGTRKTARGRKVAHAASKASGRMPSRSIGNPRRSSALRPAQRADALIGDGIGQDDIAALRQRAQDAGKAMLGAIGQDDAAGVAIARHAIQPIRNRGARP